MISDRSHHVVGSISGPGDGTGAHLKNSSVNHLNGGLVVGPAAAAAQHQANLMAGMNLINQGFHQQQQQQQHQGNHLNNIHALQQQHNHSLMQQQGHAILGSGSVSSSSLSSAGNSGQNQNNNQQNYDYAVRLAAEANSKATMEKDYYKAIILYGDAISLHNSDCRFFLNRSFCYAQLELYQLALDDAEEAIKLDPKSGKSFYRKGQALIGLKKYMDAEKAFMQVLRLEPDCPETSKQLIELRLLSLQSLGFDPDKSQMAAIKYKSIEDAISALLALRIDSADSFTADPVTAPTKWTATSSLWDHHSDPHHKVQQQQQQQQTTGWAPLTGSAHQQQQQSSSTNGSDGSLIGSGLRNAAIGAGVIGSGQSQHQTHLINGYASDYSTKGLNGSSAGGDVSTSNSNMVSSSVSNGFSSIVGSNGSGGFYQRSNERPNSSSPLDKLTDSLSSINQQQSHLSSHHHHQVQMVIGNNTINAGGSSNGSNSNGQQNRLMSGGLMNHHLNDQISVFDGSCMGKHPPPASSSSYSSAAHVANGMSNHVGHGVEHHPKNNNTANNYNGMSNSFSNSNPSAALLKHGQQKQQLHQNQASAVIGSGRHASGSSSGHVSSSITIGSFGLTSVPAAAPLVSGLSIGGGVGGGDSEPSVSPATSNSDSDNSVTITDPAAANHRFNHHHHQVMVAAVNYTQHQQQQIGNCLINGSSSAAGAPAAAAVIAGSSSSSGGSVWGSASAGGSAGGTFADIVKKKSAPAAKCGSGVSINNNNNNNNSSSRKSEIALNGRNHHNQSKPKDQTISSLESEMDPSNSQQQSTLR